MKNCRDFNFNSWIEMYDYLQKQQIKNDTILMCSNMIGDTVKINRITMRTVKQHCWNEIQALRPTREVAHEAGAVLHQDAFNAGRLTGVIKLLWLLEKK